MCTTDALHCDDAATVVRELARVRREIAGSEAERTRLLDRLTRATQAHQEQILSYDPASPTATRAARGKDPVTRWWARFDDDQLTWTSPTGHEYTTAPREDRGPIPTPLRT